MNKAAFLDRDGVINRKAPGHKYVTCWDEMRFLPGVIEAVAELNRAAFRVIVVTNQRCVAKGLVTAYDLESLHRRMCDEFEVRGASIAGVYYCPHEVSPPCVCRKPRPGMILEAAREHDIDLTASWMIGDSDIDIAAGKNAGCKTAQLLSRGLSSKADPDVVAPSLAMAVNQILHTRIKILAGRQSNDRWQPESA
jgi:D-glycero-D-manno-heptose 1,7-bisphosphate phosphatase